MLRQWEHLYHINNIAKPWPVYIGLREVRTNCQCLYVNLQMAFLSKLVGQYILSVLFFNLPELRVLQIIASGK